MKKHLDVFLAIVAIIAVGDAASLFGQNQVQQQLGATGPGGNPLGGIDTIFSGGSGGGLGGNRGSSLGALSGGLGGGRSGGGTDGGLRTDFGGGSGVPGLPGLLAGNTAGGPFSPGVGGPTASSALRQTAQQIQGVAGLGGNLPGAMNTVLAGGSGPGPVGSVASSLGNALGGLGGAGGGGAGDGRRRGLLGSVMGGRTEGGLFGGGNAEGPQNRGVSCPIRSGFGTGSLGSGSGTGASSDGLGTGPTQSGSLRSSQGPVSGVPGMPGAGLGGVLGSISTARGSLTVGSQVGDILDRGLGLGNTGRPISELRPSPGSSGPFSSGGAGGSDVGGGPFSTPPRPSGPAPSFGSGTVPGTALPGVPGGVSGPALSSSVGSVGPLSPGQAGRTGVAGRPSSTPILPSGPAYPLSSESRPGSPLSSLPGSTSEPGSPGLPSVGTASTSGSVGPGGAMSSTGTTGPDALTSVGRGSERAGQRLRGGIFSGRRTSPHGRPAGKLSPEGAAAIGLGVAGSALALGALAAGIVSAVNQRHRGMQRGGPRIRCPGCQPTTPCVGNCGRKRRSIPNSKVPAEILDSIPVNFERLY